MNSAQTLLNLHFLGLRIMLQAFDPALFVFDIPAQIRVLFFQGANLLALLVESGETLGASEHDGCVGGKSHQGSKGCNGPENG